MARFVFVLRHGDVDSATRCFQLAKIAHSKNHTVNLFFVDDGVLWADSSRDFSAKSATGDCPSDYFPYLVQNEVLIGV
jgi:tRNA 2-thiouridine synthesizing protein D